jgi:hypothetical protein
MKSIYVPCGASVGNGRSSKVQIRGWGTSRVVAKRGAVSLCIDELEPGKSRIFHAKDYVMDIYLEYGKVGLKCPGGQAVLFPERTVSLNKGQTYELRNVGCETARLSVLKVNESA